MQCRTGGGMAVSTIKAVQPVRGIYSETKTIAKDQMVEIVIPFGVTFSKKPTVIINTEAWITPDSASIILKGIEDNARMVLRVTAHVAMANVTFFFHWVAYEN